jgi:hypothetical protein
MCGGISCNQNTRVTPKKFCATKFRQEPVTGERFWYKNPSQIDTSEKDCATKIDPNWCIGEHALQNSGKNSCIKKVRATKISRWCIGRRMYAPKIRRTHASEKGCYKIGHRLTQRQDEFQGKQFAFSIVHWTNSEYNGINRAMSEIKTQALF